MKFRVGAVIIAGALFGAAALLPAVSEGRGGNPGGRGRCGQGQYQCRQQGVNCPQDRQRLRDGSCGNPDCPQTGTRQDCPGPRGAGSKGGDDSGSSSGTK
jgi:hypothetical protein